MSTLIAINPEAPEYVAKITLKPKETMKIQNRYQGAAGKWAGNLIVLYFAGIVLWALISLT